MARADYQYETSPKKLLPDYEVTQNRKAKKKKATSKKVVTEPSKKQKAKLIVYIAVLFAMMLVVSYRNSLIDERYSEVKKLEASLALLEKGNKQTEVSIERSVNLKTIKELAEGLGMQALDSSQTVNINLDKQDYIESSVEEIEFEEEQKSWLDEILEKISELFKK